MADYFYINDVPSTNYNCYIARSNIYDSASEDVEEIVIPGRNGSIFVNNKRFNSFVATIVCYIPSNMQTYVDSFRNFLQSIRDEFTYRETRKPNEYRICRFTGKFELSEYDQNGAAFSLQLICRPERFLTSGTVSTTYADGDTITNPTYMEAKPLLRVEGTGMVTLGDYSFTINSNSNYIDIDCETMQCYCGTTNLNSTVTIDEFPVLPAGDTSIELDSTITSFSIIPRWWTT